MALITCPECENKVSDRATTCIHCGYPLGNHNTDELASKKTEPIITPPPHHTHKKKGKFAKKRTGKKILKRCIIAIIGIIAFIVVGFVGLTIYWGVTDKPLDNDFDTKTECELDGLIYYVPGNWKYDEDESNYYQHWFLRYDNFDNFAAAMMVASYGDDSSYTVEEIISANSDEKDNAAQDEISVGTQQLLHASYLNENGDCCDVYAVECDGWLFSIYFQCTKDFYNQKVIEEIVGAIDFENYKNPNKYTDDEVSNTDLQEVENVEDYIAEQIKKYDTRQYINYDELKKFVIQYYDYLVEEQIEIVGIAIATCKIEDLVVDLIKDGMNNPRSFELVDFDPGYITLGDDGLYSTLFEIKFRGTNAYGGIVTDTAKGLIDFEVNFNNCTLEYDSSLIM